MSTVLVVGGTGVVGSLIVDELLKRGVEVRVLSRGSEHLVEKAKELQDKGVRMVIGDLTKPKTLKWSTHGVNYIIATTAALDNSLTAGYRRLLSLGYATGVSHVVYVSNIPRIEPLLPMFQGKKEVEEVFEECEIPYTILAAEILTQMFVNMTIVPAQAYGAPVTFYCSDESLPNARHCFVDERFVAQIASAVVGRRDTVNKKIGHLSLDCTLLNLYSEV